MRRVLSSVLVVAALGAAACGGKSTSPTAPSNAGPGAAPASPAPNGPATPSGATVMGRVLSASQGTTIGVAGTSSSAALDSSGGFRLSVSPGDVQLQVTDRGATAMVGLPGVQPAQTVEVIVNVAGTSASLESEVRHGAGEAELKGVVEALPPTTAAQSFRAAGKTIVTTTSTVFVKGGVNRTFADLGLGNRVEVHGSMSGDTLTATRVEIEERGNAAPTPTPGPTPGPLPGPNPGPNPPTPGAQVEVKGTISGLTGSASSFTFTVNGTTVKGDSTTTFGGGDSVSDSSHPAATFASLKNGIEVEVKGTRNSDSSVQATRIQIEDEDENQPEVELKGTVSGLTGTASSFQFTVNGTTVKGDSTTRFDGGDDGVADGGHSTATFADLKNGVAVEVKGTRNTDNSVHATEVQVDNENEDNEVEMQGTLGAMTGTCPAISSTVGGTKFTTSSSTRFDTSCSSLASGQKVEIKGTRNSDGSIAATRVKKD
jgi:uncharacterized protein DUF5666